MKSMHQQRRKQTLNWVFTATALAAIAACGGSDGGTEPQGPANQAPTVSIAAPAASFVEGTAIAISATAADADGTVAKVEFFNGDTKIGEDTSAPFELTWAGAPVGAHSITARATDNAGAIANSSSLAITVTATPAPPANDPPTVAITAPANNAKPNAPATLTLAASAADTDGTVASVTFYRIDPLAPVYDNTTQVGDIDTTAPFEQSTGALAAGTYTFVARATDNTGAVATSATVQVVVNALPTVSFDSPAANAVVQTGANVTLRATAADADGSVASLEFFDGATLLGAGARVGVTNEYTFAWNNVPAGPKSLTARATDNDGATQTTASVALNSNGQPTVTLDAPTAGANAPTTLALAAAASDADGTIASVQFFNGAALLGAGTYDAGTQRWRLSVPIAAAGTYNITARATDDNGGTADTASQSVTIAANVPPAVSLTSATSFDLPAAVTFAATATDSDGIAKVEFYNGATKLGEDATEPYTFTWAGATAGTYTITAQAIDTVGSTTTSTAQSVTVNPDTAAMWTTLTAAQKGGIAVDPNLPTENVAVDAVKVMTALGVNRIIPSFNPAMGFAAKRLADFIPAAGATLACPGGGTVTGSADAGGIRQLNYNNCVIDGFTFYGGAGMAAYLHIDTQTAAPPAVHPDPWCVGTYSATAPAGYRCQINSSVDYFPATDRLDITGLRVTGNGAPEPGGEAYPRNAYVVTNVDCAGAGASRTCLSSVGAHLWGTNVSWAGWTAGALLPPDAEHATDDAYVVNGTWRSVYGGTPASSNIRFEGMTNISGRAIVYGSNGYSVVTRLAPTGSGGTRTEKLSVVRTVTAVDPGFPAIGVGTTGPFLVDCTVNPAQGEWVCQPTP